MFKRRFLTWLLASLTSTVIITLYFTVAESEGFIAFFTMMFLIGSVVLPISILYGLPISLLAEKWTKKLTSYRRIIFSFLIHVSFGAAFIFIFGALFDSINLFTNFTSFWREYEWFFNAALLTSICFWGANELLRSNRKIEDKQEWELEGE